MTEIESLGVRLDRVSTQLDELRRLYEQENAKRDRRIRLNQFLIGVAILAAACGVLVGVGGIRSQQRTNRDTAAARRNSCLQYNLQQSGQASAEKAEVRTFIDALTPEPRTPDAQKRVDAFLPTYDMTVDNGHPGRDCSPEGIRKYLAGTEK